MTKVKSKKKYIFLSALIALAISCFIAGGMGMAAASSGLPGDNSIEGILPIDYVLDLNGSTMTDANAFDDYDTYRRDSLANHDRLRTRELNADYVWAMAKGGNPGASPENAYFCNSDGTPLTLDIGLPYPDLSVARYFTVTSNSGTMGGNNTKKLIFTSRELKTVPQTVYVYVAAPSEPGLYYRAAINVTVTSTLKDIAESAVSLSVICSEWTDADSPTIIKITDGGTAELNLEEIAKKAVAGGGPGILFKRDGGGAIAGANRVRDFSNINIINFSVETSANKALEAVNTINYTVKNSHGKDIGIILKADLRKAPSYKTLLDKDATTSTRSPISINLTVSDGVSRNLLMRFYVIIVAETNPFKKVGYTHFAVDYAANKEFEIRATDIATFNRHNTPSKPNYNMEISSVPILTGAAFLEARIKDSDEGSYLILKTVASGNATLMIDISYYYVNDEGQETDSSIVIPITVSVSGNVVLQTFSIKGKGAAIIYNNGDYKKPGEKLKKGLFSEIEKDGFILTGAEAYNPNPGESGDPKISKYISVEYTDRVKITPLVSTQGSLGYVNLTFMNMSGVERVYQLKIETDLKGGSIFARFEDWEIALIFIGAALGLILIVFILVRIIIVSAAKKKQEALATAAPTSAYIIKLNSTIAAAQAQTRMMTQQSQVLALNSPSQPQTLQLGYYNPTPAPNNNQTNNYYMNQPQEQQQPQVNNYNYAPPPQFGSPASDPITSGNSFSFNQGPSQQSVENIILPISDDDLVERIFVEKYEPKGMLRRSYFKNETLKKRELEKEKDRIRELIKSGVPPEEAVKSSVKRESNPIPSNPVPEDQSNATTQVDDDYARFMMLYIKYVDSSRTSFDEFYENENMKNEIMLKDFMGEPGLNDNTTDKIILPDMNDTRSGEEIKYDQNNQRMVNLEDRIKDINSRFERLQKDFALYQADIDRITEELNRNIKHIPELDEEIIGLNVKLSNAKSKEKDKIAAQINDKEQQIKTSKESIAKYNQELFSKKSELSRIEDGRNKAQNELNIVNETLNNLKKDNDSLSAVIKKNKEREAAAREAVKRAEKRDTIKDMLYVPNRLDNEIQELVKSIDANTKKRDALKVEIAAAQTQLLSTTDVKLIKTLSDSITKLNAEAAQIEKDNSKKTKAKSDKQIEMTASRRKTNERIEALEVPLEDVIQVEDEILAELAYEKYLEDARREQHEAELELFEANTAFEASTGNFATMALQNAARVSEAEAAAVDAELELQIAAADLDSAQRELDDLNYALLTATEEEQLDLGLKQFDLMQLVDEKQAAYAKAAEDHQRAKDDTERIKAAGIKANLESQMQNEKNADEAARKLDEAKSRYETASEHLERAINMTSPLNLIISGSGLVSQDRKAVEAENFKKQLEKSKGEVEQAKLQAEMVRMEAEKKAEIARLEAEQKAELARIESERKIQEAEQAKEAAKLQAELNAQEAVRRTEEALAEAERKAREEVNEMSAAAKAELEQMRLEAQKAREEAERMAIEARSEADKRAAEAKADAEKEVERMKMAMAQNEQDERAQERIQSRKNELSIMYADVAMIKTEEDGLNLLNKVNAYEMGLSDRDKVPQVMEYISKIRNEARHAQEIAIYKGLANRAPAEQRPRRTVKKVTERVNRIPNPRPAGARPAAAGARPAGARPAAAGARPAGTRPPAQSAGARPAGTRPPAQSAGARPAGTRPPAQSAGARPAGTRPPAQGAAGARPAGTRPPAQSAGARPAGTRPPAQGTGARPAGTRPAPKPGENRPR